MDSGQPIQLVGMALLRGLLDESALCKAMASELELLEALTAQGSLDAQDLEDLAGLVKSEPQEHIRAQEESELSTHPIRSARGEDPWQSLPSGDDETDGTGRQVLRVLTLATWKHYRNLRFVAEGGMGRVFKAFDPSLKRVVALKFLRREDPDLVARFELEAQNQAKVDHPNICKVFEVGEWQGQSYIAMQFLRGETLEYAALKLSLIEKVKVMEAVAEAVHAAHRQDLVHRDLKPANIIVEVGERGPKPTILDFGLARGAEATGLTIQGLVIGTTHYMAPEQARGDHDKVGRRTDVYGLGATLYRVLTGQPPFAGTGGMDVVRRTMEEDIPTLTRLVRDLPEDLDTVVRKCMEKDPLRRYESALAVAEDLRRWREGEPILARKPTLRYRADKWARKHRLVVIVGAAGVMAALVFGGMGIQARVTASAQARWAQHFTQSAERLEALARYIHLSPPHDLSAERAQFRGHLRTLEADLLLAGRQGFGPGAYALGRVHLVLGDLDEAQGYLEHAESLGFSTPEAQYALGRVLSLQYQRGVQRAQQVSDPSLRAVQMKGLEPQRSKALDCLRRGQGNALEPLAYQEGILALFEGQYDDAIAKAEAARASAPWFYEALALKADAHMARARQGIDPEARRRDLGAAGTALQSALCLAPSDPRLLESQARRWNDEMRLAWDTGGDLEPLARVQKEALNAWEVLAPADPGPRALEAWTQANLAEFHQFRGKEPGPWVKAAVDLAEGVIQAYPQNLDARVAQAAALRVEGLWKSAHGGDPVPSLLGAIEQCRAGLISAPGHTILLEILIRALVHLVEYRNAAGQDWTSTWALVQGLFPPQVLEGEAGPFLASHLAALQIEMADADLRQDLDPRPRLQRALDLLERGRSSAGDPFKFHQRLGNAHLIWGQYLQLHDLDPGSQIDAAADAYGAAMRANPARYDAAWGLAETSLLKARQILGKGGDPAPELGKGRRDLEAVARLEPSSWSCHGGWAESLFLEAEWRLQQKRNPMPVLEQALVHAKKALSLNGRRPELWVLVAKAYRFRMDHLHGDAAVRALAFNALDKALAIDPRHPVALKERDRLLHQASVTVPFR